MMNYGGIYEALGIRDMGIFLKLEQNCIHSQVLRWIHALIWAYQRRLISAHATHTVKGREKWRTYERIVHGRSWVEGG